MGISLVEHLAGIQEHRAAPYAGEIMLDLVVVHDAMLRHDTFEEKPQLRDVPLTVAQRVERPPYRIGLRDLESQIERPARGEHAQVLIENEERLVNGVHDGLR